MMNRWLSLAAAGVLVGGCATVSPSPSAPAVELQAGSGIALGNARTVWIEGAVRVTGVRPTSSGSNAPVGEVGAPVDAAGALAGTPGGAGAGERADVTDDLAAALRQVRRLELVSGRDRADLVLYFEQADGLRCAACRQPEGLWQWWGFVRDPYGRELASLHGETTAGADAAPREFTAELRALLRQARGKS